MNLSTMLVKKTGKNSGSAFATHVMKGWDVRRRVAKCRAQTIPATAQTVYDQYLKIYQKFLYTDDPVEVEKLKEDLKDMERKYGIGE
ncbi:hypothetical protein ERICIV_03395 [Paenibacillus larvae subsp. larvae]|uniref:Uncharacterized protein n=1 Tax=Paenibacillus larvae subsp. larvae TaxID=147375 RepID=A0A2L1U4D3_9BACL|nr:hypothetical protein [Paenibacillus larvae]AQT84128.1 hypothetical protein B1222_06580 [Paenibacillus larvae subsp. pulvifaciens]AQZ46105.1 hypothetical protein B5S25_05235 [Paenibacillus larvae subsp. pulvifaciens]AVF27761.1 hypothetical protein ERICIII_03652 [Paenibacillus larvae subsp. larvae]AVF32264.1 hypothetical protein ERICIV_03395 [Paenibacillus larvae subsp. larvae]MBH0343532.1 hypothetical protein [Paenibacillus larvae]